MVAWPSLYYGWPSLCYGRFASWPSLYYGRRFTTVAFVLLGALPLHDVSGKRVRLAADRSCRPAGVDVYSCAVVVMHGGITKERLEAYVFVLRLALSWRVSFLACRRSMSTNGPRIQVRMTSHVTETLL